MAPRISQLLFTTTALSMLSCDSGPEPSIDARYADEDDLVDESAEEPDPANSQLNELTADQEPKAIVLSDWGGEADDKCCDPGLDTGCVNDANDACVGTDRLVTCLPCDFINATDYCSESWSAGSPAGLGWDGGSCNGLSFEVNTGLLVEDRCSDAANDCVPSGEYGTVCTTDVENSLPNDCDPYGAVQTAHYDGAIGRMCCTTSESFTGYECVPRQMDENCYTTPMSPHTIPSYCLPCPGEDPDDRSDGAWELWGTAPGGGAEWAESVVCDLGQYNDYAEPLLPNWTNDLCTKTRYFCRGVQINAINGLVQVDSCPNWNP